MLSARQSHGGDLNGRGAEGARVVEGQGGLAQLDLGQAVHRRAFQLLACQRLQGQQLSRLARAIELEACEGGGV